MWFQNRNSYRCGVFFAGDNPGDAPRFTIFVIPKRFGMNCDRDAGVVKEEARQECFDLVSQLQYPKSKDTFFMLLNLQLFGSPFLV